MRAIRASAVEQGTGAAPSPTVRDVLRLLWEADRYPHLGNEDNHGVHCALCDLSAIRYHSNDRAVREAFGRLLRHTGPKGAFHANQ